MPSINVTGAAARLLANRTLAASGYCLHYCWLAISRGVVHYITGGAGSAYATWQAVPVDHQHSSRTVPKDFPAFLGPKLLSKAGDVILSNGTYTASGELQFVATDWPRARQVGLCTLAEREKQTGRKFVGWASSMGGYTLTTTSTAGNIGTPIEDEKPLDLGDEMKLIKHPNGQHALTDGVFKFEQPDYKGTVVDLIPIWGEPIPVTDNAWRFTQDRVNENVAWINSLKSDAESTQAPAAFSFTGTATPTK